MLYAEDQHRLKLQPNLTIPYLLASITPEQYKKLNELSKSRFHFHCLVMEIPGVELEYRFHEKRMFRFDYFIADLKLALEYEGIYAVKSRHTSHAGFNRDSTKYNLAALEGIHVLRYTAKTFKQVKQDVEQFRKRHAA